MHSWFIHRRTNIHGTTVFYAIYRDMIRYDNMQAHTHTHTHTHAKDKRKP